MDTQSIIKDLYLHELNRRLVLTDSLAVPSVILLALGSLLGYFLINFGDFAWNIATFVFLASFVISCGYLGITIRHLYLSVKEIRSPRLPYSQILADLHQQGTVDFGVHLEQRLPSDVILLSNSNDIRETDLGNAFRYLLRALVYTVVCSIPFVFQYLTTL